MTDAQAFALALVCFGVFGIGIHEAYPRLIGWAERTGRVALARSWRISYGKLEDDPAGTPIVPWLALVVGAVALVVLLVGCGGDGRPPPYERFNVSPCLDGCAPRADAGELETDAALDAGELEAGTDAGPLDAGELDAALDAGELEAGTDAAVDAGELEAGTDAAVDSGPLDAGPPRAFCEPCTAHTQCASSYCDAQGECAIGCFDVGIACNGNPYTCSADNSCRPAGGCAAWLSAGCTQCGDEPCVDLTTSEDHCGACDAPCGFLRQCTAGACSL